MKKIVGHLATLFLFLSPAMSHAGKDIHNINGFSFSTNDCWNVAGGPEDTEENDPAKYDQIDIYSTPKCSNSHKGTWQMEIGTIKDLSVDNEWYEKHRNETYPTVFKKKKTIGKYNGLVFSGLLSEKDQLVDKPQANYEWSLKVNCDKKNIIASYGVHLDKAARDKVRKNPEKMPAPFKELVDGFSCK